MAGLKDKAIALTYTQEKASGIDIEAAYTRALELFGGGETIIDN